MTFFEGFLLCRCSRKAFKCARLFSQSLCIVSHKVNGTSLLGATHLEAVRSLRGIGDDLTLLVCDGFDPAEVPAGQHATWQASPVASINTGKSQSEESLEPDVIPSNEKAYDDIRKEIKRQVGGGCLFIHFCS